MLRLEAHDVGSPPAPRQIADEPMPWRCPSCLQGWALTADGVRHCQCSGGAHDEAFADFIGGDSREAETVLGWSAQFVQHCLPRLADVKLGQQVPDDVVAKLRAARLVDATGGLTRFGQTIAYHLVEHIWQTTTNGQPQVDDQFEAIMDEAGLGSDSSVLDVGCGAAQTLRLLIPRKPALLAGVDLDPEALALAHQLVIDEPVDFRFARATGDRLPVADATFSHVICRVALNYMHQRRTLAEMVRVLQPGGYLFLRVERVWFDLSSLKNCGRPAPFVSRLRDLAWGTVHEVTGWQPVPGSNAKWNGLRAFVTARKLSSILLGLGCTIERVEESSRCPRIAGRSTQLTILARRR